jgi:hypothetical protein
MIERIKKIERTKKKCEEFRKELEGAERKITNYGIRFQNKESSVKDILSSWKDKELPDISDELVKGWMDFFNSDEAASQKVREKIREFKEYGLANTITLIENPPVDERIRKLEAAHNQLVTTIDMFKNELNRSLAVIENQLELLEKTSALKERVELTDKPEVEVPFATSSVNIEVQTKPKENALLMLENFLQVFEDLANKKISETGQTREMMHAAVGDIEKNLERIKKRLQEEPPSKMYG